MANLPMNEVEDLYNQYREISLQQWEEMDAASLGEELSSRVDASVDVGTLGTSMRLFGRLAHQTTVEEFRAAIVDGEIPPIKLSAEEMELVRGGFLISACAVVGAVASAYAAAKAW